MPAADISEVKVTYHDERRGAAEYNPPMKKAEVSLFASVPAGGDGVAALNYVTKLAQDKVKEILSGIATAPAAAEPEAPLPPTSSASQASQPDQTASEAAAAGEPQRRTRRTKAEMEAARAAEQQAEPAAGAPSIPSTADGTADAGTETSSTASAQADDEWAAAAPAEVAITDAELNHTCSVTADRVKERGKVTEVIRKFQPGGDAWDPAKPGGRKFTVNDIPANQRVDFIAQLKAL